MSNVYEVTLTREFTYIIEAEDEDNAVGTAESLYLFEHPFRRGESKDYRVKKECEENEENEKEYNDEH